MGIRPRFKNQRPRHQVARIGVFRLPSTKTSSLGVMIIHGGENTWGIHTKLDGFMKFG